MLFGFFSTSVASAATGVAEDLLEPGFELGFVLVFVFELALDCDAEFVWYWDNEPVEVLEKVDTWDPYFC